MFDPATHEVLQTVARGGADDVDDAVRAARRAAPGWAATDPTERGRLLRRWADLVLADVEELAALEASDVGKPLSGGRLNMMIAQDIIGYFAGAADKMTGVTLPTRGPDFLGYTVPEPHGVCAVVLPWNVPALLTAASIAPALAAGNTVVLKPSEIAPLAPFALAAVAGRAGLPPGVFNVVGGLGSEAGVALTNHGDIDHITFVGSTATGRAVMSAAARNLVPVSLELGGKSPNVVLADADLDVAIPAIVASITENAGQNCYAGSRLVVDRRIAVEVTERLADAMSAVRSGPWDADLDMGPLASAQQFERVREHLERARSDGARAVTGGRVGEGWYVEPTVFDQVEPTMSVARDEIFGPVLCVQPFDDLAEASRIMNDTDFGLLACIWTNDVSHALRLARDARAGQVSVNQFHDVGVIGYPFNMTKDSGFGRGGGYEAMREYSREKAVAVRLLNR